MRDGVSKNCIRSALSEKKGKRALDVVSYTCDKAVAQK